MDKAGLIETYVETHTLRSTLKRIVNQEPVSDPDVKSANEEIQVRYQEAGEYGFTKADVLRAMLWPIFEIKRGCDCPTCKARRGEPIQQIPNRETLLQELKSMIDEFRGIQ